VALLARIYRETHRTKRAIQYYRLSLELDPFLMTSQWALAELGDKPNEASVGLTPIPPNRQEGQPQQDRPLHTPVQQQQQRAHQVAARLYYPPSPVVSTPVTSLTKSLHYLPGLGSSTTTASHETSPSATLLQSLQPLVAIYQANCSYQCPQALTLLAKLSVTTAWSWRQAGRAHLESGDFVAAQRAYERAYQLEPTVDGLEYLSTVYWQLKKEVPLAHLAQVCMQDYKDTAIAWCVVGNCFSLQKDATAALTFFQRSLELDPNFAYSHTLAGYEHLGHEDFGPALSSFRQALRIAPRRYNAWYGLGTIYHCQEKYELAEYHFAKACALHPTSSILQCHWGMAQYANGKGYQALETLGTALRLDPHNPQARYQRATIYAKIHRPKEALQELLVVRNAAPRQATVHRLLGQLYKQLGDTSNALKSYLTAMDLDPHDAAACKAALDKLGVDTSEPPEDATPF